jgi:hypothetical protein
MNDGAEAALVARGILAEILDKAEPVALRTDPLVAAIRTAYELLGGTAGASLEALELRPCNSPKCKRRIAVGWDPAGRRIPLDPSAAVYVRTAIVADRLQVIRAPGLLVNHWATCADPEHFKRPRP